MKKITSLLLALLLVFYLTACGEKKNPADTKEETTKESMDESKEETKEETKEESKDETEEESKDESQNEAAKEFDRKVATGEGTIEKIGLGMSVGLDAKELKEGKGETTSNVTIAGLAFDKDGKIVKAYIDVAQSKFPVKDDGTFETEPDNATFKTKQELGDEYGMKKTSAKIGIGKEYFEQANAFAEYIIGKTAEEVAAIPTAKKDDHHLNVPKDADLLASVTIDIGAYQKAVLDAWENAIEAKGAEKLGLSISTKLGHATAAAKDDKGAEVQFETSAVLAGVDKDSKVVNSSINTAQNSIAFKKDGTVETDLTQPGTTKRDLGDKYDMKKASKIGKEWFEQIDGLQAFSVGKTADDISGLELDKGKAKDADLLATTTITITEYVENLAKAIQTAK